MPFELSVTSKRHEIVVPSPIDKKNPHRKRVLHPTDEDREEVTRGLYLWQACMGEFTWGKERWESIKKHGAATMQSKHKGVSVVYRLLDGETSEPSFHVISNSKGCRKATKAFGIKKHGDVAEIYAQLQVCIQQARNTRSEFVLPISLYKDLFGPVNNRLFPLLKLGHVGETEVIYYDPKQDYTIFDY